MEDQKVLREHLLELLEGRSAHIDLETAIRAFPINRINDRPDASPHTAWEILEHIRITLSDIAEFCVNGSHVSPDFPEGYWNKEFGTAIDWQTSSEQIFADMQRMRDIVTDESIDLFAKIPHGIGQTFCREVLLAADHNSYHLGQMMLLKKILENINW